MPADKYYQGPKPDATEGQLDDPGVHTILSGLSIYIHLIVHKGETLSNTVQFMKEYVGLKDILDGKSDEEVSAICEAWGEQFKLLREDTCAMTEDKLKDNTSVLALFLKTVDGHFAHWTSPIKSGTS